MPTVSATLMVHASPDEVFNFVADYRNVPKMQPQFSHVRLISDIERGLGAVIELRGHFRGLPMNATTRIIAFVPPTRIVSVSEGAVLSRSTWVFRPVSEQPDQCEVTLTIDYKLRGDNGSLMSSLAQPLERLFQSEVQSMTGESLRRLHEVYSPDDPTDPN